MQLTKLAHGLLSGKYSVPQVENDENKNVTTTPTSMVQEGIPPRMFKTLVAARPLHLSKGVEKPSGRVTYTVVLEGLCRFSVLELSTRGIYQTAKISPLEMTMTEMEQIE
ncbi:hypothetical protein RYX36_026270 [Vicia faba]